MNLNFLITDISVIKDFGTKKIIITTPSEAQEMIFSLERDLSDKFLKWQQGNSGGRDFNASGTDLEQLFYKLSINKNMDEVYKLLSGVEKK
ncbi:MAG: hypothetical protein ACMZI0_11830 [Symbiopectobacterium sp.]|uniref:hypothetical protein n=1 Tax=Symbiopectobacterium sp. TaxID=2952789 RepID=UPI0039EADC16